MNVDLLRQDIAAATAHRACCGTEADPANGWNAAMREAKKGGGM